MTRIAQTPHDAIGQNTILIHRLVSPGSNLAISDLCHPWRVPSNEPGRKSPRGVTRHHEATRTSLADPAGSFALRPPRSGWPSMSKGSKSTDHRPFFAGSSAVHSVSRERRQNVIGRLERSPDTRLVAGDDLIRSSPLEVAHCLQA